MKPRVGDLVEVRTREKILATLDKNGRLEELPSQSNFPSSATLPNALAVQSLTYGREPARRVGRTAAE
jgi:hypothetical protein